MNQVTDVNTLSNRLSLRNPQRESLELLSLIADIIPLRRNQLLIGDSEEQKKEQRDVLASLLKIVHTTFRDDQRVCNTKIPNFDLTTHFDFERDFPSFCFALATGVGKTRLMGAFIAYLNLVHGNRNFFVLAPSLTIYEKLIADFTPGTSKYVFKGIQDYSLDAPAVVTGDNYEKMGSFITRSNARCIINIFNISKINTEVRGGNTPRIKRLSEYIGQSYFDYLASQDDLVMIMDESHRYRASAGIRVINELNPVLGLELTATPQIEKGQNTVPFKNVLYDYPLGQAMEDGFVKQPEVLTRKNFIVANISSSELERIKLEDGIRLHEIVKIDLDTFALERGLPTVKPFVLVIARDTTHAKQLQELIISESFFEGRYKNKVIQVDYETSKEDEIIQRLLRVENFDEPTEIVIHVNKLKEGWDVKNLYTIIPLRAANARTLVEQSIGRGLRLPYGKRTGNSSVDTVRIVAHDKFQEIIDEASQGNFSFCIKQRELSENDLTGRLIPVMVRPMLDHILESGQIASSERPFTSLSEVHPQPPLFTSKAECDIAQLTQKVITALGKDTNFLPGTSYLEKPEVQAKIVEIVSQKLYEGFLPGIEPSTDNYISDIVTKTTEQIVQKTIDIPRITVMPDGKSTSAFEPFQINVSKFNFQPVSEDLFLKNLATQEERVVSVGMGKAVGESPENSLVFCLLDYDDICYDDNSDLLFELAGLVVQRLREYLLSEQDVENVARFHAKAIAQNLHAQMQSHRQEVHSDTFCHRVTHGFVELKQTQFGHDTRDPILDFRIKPAEGHLIARYIFSGFERCLYAHQKFHSDTERILANILDKESLKWFRPVAGQFMIFYRFYRDGSYEHEYQPDFVAETETAIYMLESKAANCMADLEVQIKKKAAVQWCERASQHNQTYGRKPWIYVLIPHDAVFINRTLENLVASVY